MKIRRRDRPGHIDAKYAAELLQIAGRTVEPRAFLAHPRNDDLVEGLEEELIEENGGPFVVTSAEIEFAHDTDESNPIGATREPFPTT
jgi:hypothetical protein